jgi:hypothetical protein
MRATTSNVAVVLSSPPDAIFWKNVPTDAAQCAAFLVGRSVRERQALDHRAEPLDALVALGAAVATRLRWRGPRYARSEKPLHVLRCSLLAQRLVEDRELQLARPLYVQVLDLLVLRQASLPWRFRKVVLDDPFRNLRAFDVAIQPAQLDGVYLYFCP